VSVLLEKRPLGMQNQNVSASNIRNEFSFLAPCRRNKLLGKIVRMTDPGSTATKRINSEPLAWEFNNSST
jgi:hypothetical protein